MEKLGDEYGTPLELYEELNKRFYFSLDPCTTRDNPLETPNWVSKEGDGLIGSWAEGPVFMNPPYSNPLPWAKKAYEESLKGVLVVGLMRHDPSTKWWNKWVKDKALVIPVPYRIKFVGADASYNFPNAIIIWHGLFLEGT